MTDILSFFDRNQYIKCVICGRLIKISDFSEKAGSIGVCKNCSEHLPIAPVGAVFEEKHSDISYSMATFFYRTPIRELIIDFKFNSCTAYAELFSAYMYTYSLPHFGNGHDFDIVVPVPLSEPRLKERGYNQAELISRSLAERMDICHRADGLARVRATKRQSDLSPWKRADNIDKAFQADKSIVCDKSVLLIDDVYTTGSTVKECAKTLKAAGASKVCVYTLARQPGIRKSKEYNELLYKSDSKQKRK